MTGKDNQHTSHADILEFAVLVARRSGSMLKSRLETDFLVEYKGEVDIVTEVDRAVQGIIEAEVLARYPGHGILAEEGLDKKGEDGYVWVVDPIDGTTNFAHGYPVFSVSIGVILDGEPVCGVVHNPMSDETFTGLKGEGSSLNGMAIKVSGTDTLNRSLLATGFPYDIRETRDNNLGHFSDMAVLVQGIRRCGSAALDLCSVACGRIDGFWELGLRPWDIAAGVLIVREAGGRVTDFNGRELSLDGARVLASNGLIHDQMAEVLAGSGPGQGQD